MNSSCSTRPLSPPTNFIRAPGSLTLKTRVLAVLVSDNRTTSSALQVRRGSGSPLTRKTLPKRPIAEYLVLRRLNGATLVLDEDVIKGQDQVAIDRRPVVGLGRDNEDVAVHSQLLGVVITDVRVIPVQARIGELNAVAELSTNRNRCLSRMRHASYLFPDVARASARWFRGRRRW